MSSHLHQVNQKKLEIYQLEHELIDIKEYCDGKLLNYQNSLENVWLNFIQQH